MATQKSNRIGGGRIAPKQIGIIKMAQAQLGLDDVTYRQLLADEFNKTSSTQLTAMEANRLIDILQKKGFALKPKKQGWNSAAPRPGKKRTTKKGKNVVMLASREERAKIAVLVALISWRSENGAELFLAKRLGIKNGKVVTSSDALHAIEGLKKMFENGMKAKYGKEWWLMQFDDPRVMEYIDRHCPKEYK
ncbi:MAG: hypothetical protein C0622_02265 [Desulfuromonas sp.]|nr:MAG: hypothetical protein C0622_02265 [Desulfuromonas sp.]